MFIPTPCLPCQLFCGWICTIKGWVVLESLILAATYFVAAYVLREVIFPVLKDLFQNWFVYQFAKDLLADWIADVKLLFYGALVYIAIGVAGLLGAILQIQILLWIYAAYLLVSLGVNAKKLWDVLQSILDALDDLKKACGIVSAPFGGNCDAFFQKLDYYMYGGAGFIFLCQSLTLTCVLVLIRRNYKKTHSLLFTFCGHSCGGGGGKSRKGSSEKDLEKAIPLGRRRRGAARALLQRADAQDEKAPLRERVAALPRSSFELERRRPAEKRRGAAGAGAAAPTSAYSLGKKLRRTRQCAPTAAVPRHSRDASAANASAGPSSEESSALSSSSGEDSSMSEARRPRRRRRGALSGMSDSSETGSDT
ncbi:hypothetical protein JCM10450v2_000935 [Rhodotorula kratochvilovae]